MRIRHVTGCLTLIVAGLLLAPEGVAAPPASASAPDAVAAGAAPFGEHAMPALPIFFGQSFEGRLAETDGVALSRYGATVDTPGELQPFPSAHFQIDLIEGETISYGGRADLAALVHFFVAVEPAGGGVEWAHVPEWTTALMGSMQCLVTMPVRRSGRYRIEVTGSMGPVGQEYRFFLLPDRQRKPTLYPLCGGKLLSDAQPYFTNAGQPASLAAARAWQDRAPVYRFPAPPVFSPEPSADAVAYAQGKPEPLRPYYQALYVDGEHNAVLNFERLGLAAMELGAWDEAEWAFDGALERIEAVYGRNPIAEAARSKWTEEAIKDFKGEPYERAMAYYYRGLLYLRAGDYENARATFMAGEFQDTLSEAEQFQGDFALLNFLAGWASYCIGDEALASDAFAAATSIDAGLRAPGAGEDTLLIADLGTGPVKLTRGSRGRLLGFADSVDSGRDEQAMVGIGDGPPVPMREAANIHFQATTRGGRAFGAILDGKARLRSGLARMSDASFALGQSGSAELAAVGLIAGAVTGLIGGEVKPEADIRMWDTLPHRVSIALAHTAGTGPGTYRFTVGDAHTTPWPMTVMQARHGRCAIAWTRSRSVLEAGAGVPGNDARIVKARLRNREARMRDEAFRASLTSADQR